MHCTRIACQLRKHSKWEGTYGELSKQALHEMYRLPSATGAGAAAARDCGTLVTHHRPPR